MVSLYCQEDISVIEASIYLYNYPADTIVILEWEDANVLHVFSLHSLRDTTYTYKRYTLTEAGISTLNSTTQDLITIEQILNSYYPLGILDLHTRYWIYNGRAKCNATHAAYAKSMVLTDLQDDVAQLLEAYHANPTIYNACKVMLYAYIASPSKYIGKWLQLVDRINAVDTTVTPEEIVSRSTDIMGLGYDELLSIFSATKDIKDSVREENKHYNPTKTVDIPIQRGLE